MPFPILFTTIIPSILFFLLHSTTTAFPQTAADPLQPILPRALTLTNGGVHTLPTLTPPASSSSGVLTILTMEIGPPVTVTSQRQMVQSYVPVLTICPLEVAAAAAAAATPLLRDPIPAPAPPSFKPPHLTNRTLPATPTAIPLPLSPLFFATLPPGPRIPVAAVNHHHAPHRRDIANVTSLSSSAVVGAGTTCSTSYSTTLTPICATTLSPLAAPVIPITRCDQNVTFSSQFGFSIVPSATTAVEDQRGAVVKRQVDGDDAQIETLTTYYAAPWSDLTAGSVPTGPVDAVVCSDVTTAGGSSSSGAGCITSSEIWSTGVSEVQAVATTTLDVQIQVTGPANVIIGLDITTIPISSATPTFISLSKVIETTHTSTSSGVTKASPLDISSVMETSTLAAAAPVPTGASALGTKASSLLAGLPPPILETSKSTPTTNGSSTVKTISTKASSTITQRATAAATSNASSIITTAASTSTTALSITTTAFKTSTRTVVLFTGMGSKKRGVMGK